MLELLIDTQEKLNIKPQALCQGLCTTEMYSMVIKEKRYLDRVTIKRLIARIGVDNADYENYLHFTDYDMWIIKIKMIYSLESGKIDEAEQLLKSYPWKCKGDSDSRKRIEKQFMIFMKLQIMRCKSNEEYEKNAKNMYGEALALTVSVTAINTSENMLLSPLEFSLLLENKRRLVNNTLPDIWNMYLQFISYVESSTYGKLAKLKVYPKLVTCMYKDVSACFCDMVADDIRDKKIGLLVLCDLVLSMLKDRKSLLYMTEILEMKKELLQWLHENGVEKYNDIECKNAIDETIEDLKTLKEIYKEYGVNAYMMSDSYFYRESGNFCIGDVIFKRRKSLGINREKLTENICSVRSLMREEKRQTVMQKWSFRGLFNRLQMNPNYIDTGIVTDRKEQVELYEELRFAENSFMYDTVWDLLMRLKEQLPEHPINKQILKRIESVVKYKKGEMGLDEYIKELKIALSYTIDTNTIIYNSEYIFLTQEEMITFYLISEAFKSAGNIEEACRYIEPLWKQCREMEEARLEMGRIGRYELIATYMSSLLGDLGKFDESNDISDNLIKLCLKLRRSHKIHPCLYDKAWNNNEQGKKEFDYCKELKRCIQFSQLTRDINDEMFYRQKLVNYNRR